MAKRWQWIAQGAFLLLSIGSSDPCVHVDKGEEWSENTVIVKLLLTIKAEVKEISK